MKEEDSRQGEMALRDGLSGFRQVGSCEPGHGDARKCSWSGGSASGVGALRSH